MTQQKSIKLTLIKSAAGRKLGHAACVRGLGLRRTNDTVTVQDTPEIRGMIQKVAYLLKVEK
ncbi:MAG: 50S ribosomal protein L30 [Gammaproteobacteria bacterium RIFCSPHIGHO2_12_FULL_42_13]|nr:MAG: 50S ribosomal protein L30 [Gammaproteobacteria bacterium RIFCSPHIGHO2_12_FULL_42_13]